MSAPFENPDWLMPRTRARPTRPTSITRFDQVKKQLVSEDRLSLDTPLQGARADQAAQQWISDQPPIDGPPLQDRVTADPNLPADA